MVHIQYQESVHCLAFVLNLLGKLNGGLEPVFRSGLSVNAQAQPYQPPNTQAYPYVVDGKCVFHLQLGATKITGRTDFKRGGPGRNAGQSRVWRMDNLSRSKQISWKEKSGFRSISNHKTASTVTRMRKSLNAAKDGRSRLHVTKSCVEYSPIPISRGVSYQLSSVLWRSSWQKAPVELDSLDALMQFEAGFESARSQFARYV